MSGPGGILPRLALVGLILLAGAFAAMTGGPERPGHSGVAAPSGGRTEQAPPSGPDLDRLEAALAGLEAARSGQGQGQAQAAAPSLAVLFGQERRPSATSVLSGISTGPRGSLAVIDGRVYGRGDVLPDGRRVQSISQDSVLLDADGRSVRLTLARLDASGGLAFRVVPSAPQVRPGTSVVAPVGAPAATASPKTAEAAAFPAGSLNATRTLRGPEALAVLDEVRRSVAAGQGLNATQTGGGLFSKVIPGATGAK